MADNNHNIKPVENLQNIGRLDPVGRRKERKRKQNTREQQQEQNELNEENLNDETFESEDDQHAIDYYAWYENIIV